MTVLRLHFRTVQIEALLTADNSAQKPSQLPSAATSTATQNLKEAVLDTQSPARGLLKEAEAERLAHLPKPRNLEFVKGGIQPASEGAI